MKDTLENVGIQRNQISMIPFATQLSNDPLKFNHILEVQLKLDKQVTSWFRQSRQMVKHELRHVLIESA